MVAAPQAQTKRQFLMITPEELKLDYKAKLIKAEAYLYYLIKAKNKAGWEWRLNVKQFCAEWEIAERTFYLALSKLKANNLVSWRSGDNTLVVSWGQSAKTPNVHSSDSANSPNPGIVMPLQDVAEPLQDVAEPLQDVAEPLQDVAEKNLETLSQTESCNSSYIEQIYSDIHTDKEAVCEEEVFEKEEELPQVVSEEKLDLKEQSPKPHVAVKNNIDSASKPQNPSEDPDSAPTLKRANKWNEFLKWKAKSLVESSRGKVGEWEGTVYAKNWANKNPELAQEQFEYWLRENEPKKNLKDDSLGGYSNRPEAWHRVHFREFLEEAAKNGIDFTLSKFRSYEQRREGATQCWLRWILQQFEPARNLAQEIYPEVFNLIATF